MLLDKICPYRVENGSKVIGLLSIKILRCRRRIQICDWFYGVGSTLFTRWVGKSTGFRGAAQGEEEGNDGNYKRVVSQQVGR